ncbi:MAG: helix-turn-helix transcriptional regulator [Firmicutes bacterium]|nr:helix-turn-helix transcriptional regulator [Bacillota bacterium]
MKLTQGEFAKPLAISRGYVASIENNLQKPSEALLKLISHEHGISIAWIKDGAGEMFIRPEDIAEKGVSHFGGQHIPSLFDYTEQAADKLPFEQPHESAAKYRTGSDSDRELNRMLYTLRLLWSLNDNRLKSWAVIQFDRAFPPDIIEKAQKRRRDTTGR